MKWFRFLFIVLLSVGCKKYLDIEITDKGRKPVVNAFFINDSILKLYLYQSIHILDNPQKVVINQAQVIVFNNQIEYTIPFNNISECYTLDSLIITENKLYNVKILTPLGNIEKDIKTVAKLNYVEIDTSTFFNEYEKQINLKIKFKDDALQKNYYILYITKNNELQYITTEDMTIDVINEIAFFTDEMFNGENKTIQTYFYLSIEEGNNFTNVIDIYLINADEHSFKYFYSTKKQVNSKFNPFSEPVMIYSNVTNGYGIIGSYSITRNTFTITF